MLWLAAAWAPCNFGFVLLKGVEDGVEGFSGLAAPAGNCWLPKDHKFRAEKDMFNEYAFLCSA